MYRGFRFTLGSVALLIALVGLSACGGSGGLSSDAVVQVNGNPITKSTFNHWMAVAASSSTVATGSKPAIPEPPTYSACIAHLRETQAKQTEPKPAKGQKPKPKAQPQTEAQLKTQCETQYKSLQTEVLGFLISSSWVLGEGSAQGVKLTDKEVEKQFLKIKSAQFPKAAEFEKFLATSGQTVSDLLLRVKLNLLSQKVEAKVTKQKADITEAEVEKYYNANKSRFATPATHGKPATQEPLSKVKSSIKTQLASQGQQTALSNFVKDFKKRWQAKTECRSGFMVADCKGYKAPNTATPTEAP